MAYDGIDGSSGVTPTSPLEFLLEANHSFGGEVCPIAKSGRGFRVRAAICELVEVGEHDKVAIGGSVDVVMVAQNLDSWSCWDAMVASMELVVVATDLVPTEYMSL